MRKNKVVKRKEIIFDMDEWAVVEQRAATVKMKTAAFIQRMAVDGKILRLENNDTRNVITAMNRIGVSINQIVRKAKAVEKKVLDRIKPKNNHHDVALLRSEIN